MGGGGTCRCRSTRGGGSSEATNLEHPGCLFQEIMDDAVICWGQTTRRKIETGGEPLYYCIRRGSAPISSSERFTTCGVAIYSDVSL